MRSLVYDEITPADMEKLAARLGEICVPSAVEGVYWLELPDDLLTPEQASHTQCRPQRVSLVLEPGVGDGSLRLELLVRSASSLRCACTGYTTGAQRTFCFNFLEKLMEEQGVST